MKVLALGKIPPSSFVGIKEVSFVETPEEADVVILGEGLKSYFLGTQLGELIERSYSLEFSKGKPSVKSLTEFINCYVSENQVNL